MYELMDPGHRPPEKTEEELKAMACNCSCNCNCNCSVKDEASALGRLDQGEGFNGLTNDAQTHGSG